MPFPYTDRDTRQRRPALVVRPRCWSRGSSALAVMITSAENRSWTDDVAIVDYLAAGWPPPSVVRPAKIATVEARHVEPIGQAAEEVTLQVMERVSTILGFGVA
ncbi:type II toxin-antitoxin system PemK/MazF family toxin [Rhizobium tarimense]|nr:type II toxin-antitoxin system PemK/MazF family toxin [Pseudorhizobium tarimense]